MSSVPTHSASSFTLCSPCGVSSSNDKNNVDDDDSATTLSSPIPSSTNSSPGAASLDNRNAVPIVVTEHMEISAASALQQLKQQQQQQQQQLPPPPPLPITTTTTTTNVGELVNKAKKAAASLWMILHAQVRYVSLESPLASFVLIEFLWSLSSSHMQHVYPLFVFVPCNLYICN